LRAAPMLRVYDAAREWVALSGRTGADERTGCRNSDKGDLAAIGRPHQSGIAIDAGIQIAEGIFRRRIEPDKTMIAAPADEREFASIGRPRQLGLLSLLRDHVPDVLTARLH